ncbi:sulfurtransferase [Paenibacillus sp. OAS669]|uniref:sulfurtransferase n=1 Tax=Paenibacillus sp. OAS669 TaxID=2663821 RepID=UPI00178921DF|nr:sulfurtransferase [Paenibacillus sp. OAS669]MBE1445234.1 thiosulfate/3-mercaptopyruvate sulfurtransferase [Paenibacillus sp. OAS669]
MSNPAIVGIEWLQNRLKEGNIVIADVRFNPKEAQYGKQAYEAGHLPGAVFVDFKADLTDPAGEHGGRSPLPSPERLAKRFGSLGIDTSSTVVVYEDVNGPAASRLWWVLQYIGVEDVRILDGGFQAWAEDGLPVSTEKPLPEARVLIPAVKEDWIVDVHTVKAVVQGEKNGRLIDSRDRNQYLGIESPFDPVAGHIPGAVNYFWKDGLEARGTWKSSEELEQRFSGLSKEEELIVYCGSGISATPNVLALKEAGFKNVRLYPGSWSDWISYKDNPIATGDE